MGYSSIAIEDLRPGDWVLSHDGQLHHVLRVIHRTHSGPMIGIRHAQSPEALWLTGDHRVLCRRRAQPYGGESSWKHVPNEHFGRARELRHELTPSEKSLWHCLRCEQAGVKFRRQHPIGPYIADFYSREAGLIVEVDGDSHFNPEAQTYDAERTAYFQSLGLSVLRCTNLEARKEREAVLSEIARFLDETKPSEHHDWQWRRADGLREGDVLYCYPPVVPPSTGGQILGRPSTGGHEFSFPVDGEGRDGVSGATVNCEDRDRPPIDPPVVPPSTGGQILGRPSTVGHEFSFPVDGEGQDGVHLRPAEIVSIDREETQEEVYDLEVEGAHSYVTEVCSIHNCGSGTTMAVAERKSPTLRPIIRAHCRKAQCVARCENHTIVPARRSRICDC